MTNREEHDLAAKAAGYTLTWKKGSCKGGAYEAPFIERNGELVPWRPKDDDGDAFRLAVRAHMEVNNIIPDAPSFVYASNPGMVRIREEKRGDPEAATRLAIFRAAIEVGKAMG